MYGICLIDEFDRVRITADCTLQDFRCYLTEEGQRIPKRAIDKIVRSMRGRVNEVLRNGGGHIHYPYGPEVHLQCYSSALKMGLSALELALHCRQLAAF